MKEEDFSKKVICKETLQCVKLLRDKINKIKPEDIHITLRLDAQVRIIEDCSIRCSDCRSLVNDLKNCNGLEPDAKRNKIIEIVSKHSGQKIEQQTIYS